MSFASARAATERRPDAPRAREADGSGLPATALACARRERRGWPSVPEPKAAAMPGGRTLARSPRATGASTGSTRPAVAIVFGVRVRRGMRWSCGRCAPPATSAGNRGARLTRPRHPRARSQAAHSSSLPPGRGGLRESGWPAAYTVALRFRRRTWARSRRPARPARLPSSAATSRRRCAPRRGGRRAVAGARSDPSCRVASRRPPDASACAPRACACEVHTAARAVTSAPLYAVLRALLTTFRVSLLSTMHRWSTTPPRCATSPPRTSSSGAFAPWRHGARRCSAVAQPLTCASLARRSNRSLAHLEAGAPEDALRDAQSATTLRPDNVKGWYRKARTRANRWLSMSLICA
jgi:hypothetical protein